MFEFLARNFPVYYIHLLPCSYQVLFAKITTTVFSASARLGGHVTRDCNFLGSLYVGPEDRRE